MAALARPFVVNDLDYRPFGLEWLRGVTPARLGVVLAICAGYAFVRIGAMPLVLDFPVPIYFKVLLDRTTLHFAAAMPLLLLVVWTERATARWPYTRRVAALGLAVAAGATVMAFSMSGLNRASISGDRYWWWILNLCFQGVAWGGLAVGVAEAMRRTRNAERRRHQARLDTVRLDRDYAEARLQLLRAQIEPHFLFNTLASVKLLHATDPSQGCELVRNLRHYLAMAIPASRNDAVRLGDEVALARAYLDILRVRMGERLQVSVDVPAALHDALLPPLMLGTLVENAVKHGISPRGTGGCVRIEAARAGAMLEVRVVDDGVGFRGHAGNGVGLSNTRARLRALHGDGAELALQNNAAGGVSAQLTIPWREAARVAA